MGFSTDDPVFNTVIDQYLRLDLDPDSSRILKDLKEEFKTKKDYAGREVYELLQNAEDQDSDYVIITHDPDNATISVENGGEKCVPFSKKGFISIMLADMSPKIESGEKQYIGSKGLGFRSILNWAKSIEIKSSGVCCEFSREIADGWWPEIEESIRKKDPANAQRIIAAHCDIAKNRFGFNTPIPTLAKPKVTGYDGKSTIISVRYDKNDERVTQSIQTQLNSLSGSILLFLRNIKELTIKDGGETREYTCKNNLLENLGDKTAVSEYTIQGTDTKEFFVYKKRGETDKNKYEVGLAYGKDESFSGEYLYTFFPTAMRLGLPCVVHTTFDLTSSRNALMKDSRENDELMKILGASLLEFASWLASRAGEKGVVDWRPAGLLQLNKYDQKDYPLLWDAIQKGRRDCAVYPLYRGSYDSFEHVFWHGRDFTAFLEKIDKEQGLQGVFSKCFSGHVKDGAPDGFLLPESAESDDFVEDVNCLSEAIQRLEDDNRRLELRLDLIEVLLNGGFKRKYHVLLDEAGQVSSVPVYIFTGNALPDPPDGLGYTFINPRLREGLENRLDTSVAETIRKRISAVAEIRRTDVSDLKDRIKTYTTDGAYNIERFKQLVRSFFSGKDTIEDSIADIINDLYFFDRKGNKCHPSEMVLVDGNVPDGFKEDWCLYGTLDEWTEYLKSDRESVREFFHKTLRVSYCVPMEFVSFGEDDGYLSKYSFQYRLGKKPLYSFGSGHIKYYNSTCRYPNYAYVIMEDFLNDYLCKLKANDFLGFIWQDANCREAISNRVILHQFRSLNTERDVRSSYLEYKLSQTSYFQPLQYYIVSDKLALLKNGFYKYEKLDGRTDQETQQILINLGATESMADLSVEKLYSILGEISEPKGVSDVYNRIREAFRPHWEELKSHPEQFPVREEFIHSGQLFARKDGVVSKYPVQEVYYWDNNQLPRHILDSKPKLEIGNRVGEDSVEAVFGVKLAKNISITIADTDTYDVPLTGRVNSYVRERLKFILSSCYKNQQDFVSSYVTPLKDIEFFIYPYLNYRADGQELPLEDGEMIVDPDKNKRRFHICSKIRNFGDVLDDFKLCEALVESICITLKITGKDTVSAFRNILSSSIDKNEYLWKKDIDLDVKNDIQKAIGLSDAEKAFWKAVAEQKGIEIDLSENSALGLGSEKKKEYLRGVFGVDFQGVFPDSFPEFADLPANKQYDLLNLLAVEDLSFLGPDGLKAYYEKRIREIKDVYRSQHDKKRYDAAVEELKNKPGDESVVLKYYNDCQDYNILNEKELGFIEENRFALLSEEQLQSFITQEYGFESNLRPIFVPPTRPEYIAILNEFNRTEPDLNQQDGRQFLIFEGFDDKVREIVSKISQQERDDVHQANAFNLDDIEPGKLQFGQGRLVKKSGDDKAERSRSGGNYNKRTANLYRKGKNAEMLVLKTLSSMPDKYVSIVPQSTISAASSGTDNAPVHCDFIYYKKDNPTVPRYLEVKSMEAGSVYLSDSEYNDALRYKDAYDFAIVEGNNVTILETPFNRPDPKDNLSANPDMYRIDFEIDVM